MKLDEINYGLMGCVMMHIDVHESIPAERLVTFLMAFFDSAPSLTPERFDPFAPVRTKFTRRRFHALVHNPDVSRHLMVHGADNSYTINRGTGDGNEHWHIDFDLARIPIDVVLQAADYMMRLPSDFAILHALSQSEVAYCQTLHLAVPRSDGYAVDWFTSGRRAFGLPTLAWRTYFGPMYIRHFGKERLLSAPAYAARQVHPEVISIQLSDSISRIDSDWDAFHATRQRVIEHLGAESFQRVRGPGDPPPMGDLDRNGVPGKSVPSELVPMRRKIEEQWERERMPQPPAIENLDDMAKNPGRFRVVQIKVGKNQTDMVVVDTYREEMMGFADSTMRDHYVRELLNAGAEFKKLG